MAEVLGRSKLFSPCAHVPASPSSKRSSTCLVALHLSSSRPSRPLRSSLSSGFYGRRLVVGDRNGKPFKANTHAAPVKMALSIGKGLKWWEKGLQPNMKEVRSAQDLVDSLLNAGNQLVIVDFFSPGCGGCKALHPKICQIAEMNPEVLFLQVNYEEHKSMCYSLNVHVLPFFRFYRGAHGRLCSFSCTNATIKKFKDALTKHSTERCSLGPAKGLEESELLALAANKDLNFSHTTKKLETVSTPEEISMPVLPSPKILVPSPLLSQGSEDKALVGAGG